LNNNCDASFFKGALSKIPCVSDYVDAGPVANSGGLQERFFALGGRRVSNGGVPIPLGRIDGFEGGDGQDDFGKAVGRLVHGEDDGYVRRHLVLDGVLLLNAEEKKGTKPRAK